MAVDDQQPGDTAARLLCSVAATNAGGVVALQSLTPVNRAVTVRVPLMVTVHEPVPVQPFPDHPAKSDPSSAAASKVIWDPTGTVAEHPPSLRLHKIDPLSLVTTPEPGPATRTVSVAVAVTVKLATVIVVGCPVSHAR